MKKDSLCMIFVWINYCYWKSFDGFLIWLLMLMRAAVLESIVEKINCHMSMYAWG